uniref:Uncharacterized protein n=1 Tax=Arundo donax TaxID=35708 RepID=A0A0A8XQW1_ARUDO
MCSYYHYSSLWSYLHQPSNQYYQQIDHQGNIGHHDEFQYALTSH